MRMKLLAVLAFILFSLHFSTLLAQSTPATPRGITPEMKAEILKEWETAKQKYAKSEDREELKDAPRTMKEAMESLASALSPEDREKFKNADKSDTVSLHFGMGMGLRNGWGLWGKSKLYYNLFARGIDHPDGMSGILLESFIDYMKGKEWRLAIEVKNPRYFEIVDAVTIGDTAKLDKLLAGDKAFLKLEPIKEFGLLDIAIGLCDVKSLQKLLDAGVPIDGNLVSGHVRARDAAIRCNVEVVDLIVQKKPEVLKLQPFYLTASKNQGILAKYCSSLARFVAEGYMEELINNAALYGSLEDIQCIVPFMKSKPIEFPVTVLASKVMTPEKEKFILEHLSKKLPVKKLVLDAASEIAAKQSGTALQKFIKLAGITKADLLSSWVISGCARNKDTSAIDVLLSMGVSPTYYITDNGKTLLGSAIQACNPLTIDHLLEKGVVLDVLTAYGNPPAFYPCFQDIDESLILKYLVVRGMNVMGRKMKGLLTIIVSQESFDLIKFLVSAGVDITNSLSSSETINPSEKNLLITSMDNSDPQVFELVFKEGGYNINTPDEFGRTPFHYAALKGKDEMIKKIISWGGQVNAKTNKDDWLFALRVWEGGNTPLMHAVASPAFDGPSLSTIKLLLANGADPAIKNDKGETALEIASLRLKELLKQDSELQSDKEYSGSKDLFKGEIARLKAVVELLSAKSKEK